jgi:hypothetical protein
MFTKEEFYRIIVGKSRDELKEFRFVVYSTKEIVGPLREEVGFPGYDLVNYSLTSYEIIKETLRKGGRRRPGVYQVVKILDSIYEWLADSWSMYRFLKTFGKEIPTHINGLPTRLIEKFEILYQAIKTLNIQPEEIKEYVFDLKAALVKVGTLYGRYNAISRLIRTAISYLEKNLEYYFICQKHNLKEIINYFIENFTYRYYTTSEAREKYRFLHNFCNHYINLLEKYKYTINFKLYIMLNKLESKIPETWRYLYNKLKIEEIKKSKREVTRIRPRGIAFPTSLNINGYAFFIVPAVYSLFKTAYFDKYEKLFKRKKKTEMLDSFVLLKDYFSILLTIPFHLDEFYHFVKLNRLLNKLKIMLMQDIHVIKILYEFVEKLYNVIAGDYPEMEQKLAPNIADFYTYLESIDIPVKFRVYHPIITKIYVEYFLKFPMYTLLDELEREHEEVLYPVSVFANILTKQKEKMEKSYLEIKEIVEKEGEELSPEEETLFETEEEIKEAEKPPEEET